MADNCGNSSLVGRLDKTEEFATVDSIDQEWKKWN